MAPREPFYNRETHKQSLIEKGLPMGCAEVILLSEVRASSQWQGLRDDLHARFDQWLDCLQSQLPDPQAPLAEVTEAVWNLRQDLTSGLSETIVKHAHVGELTRQCAHCPRCDRRLPASAIGGAHGRDPGWHCASGAALLLLPLWMRWLLSLG